MIRKLASGQYRLYSRKKNPKTANSAILQPSEREKKPRLANEQSNTSNVTDEMAWKTIYRFPSPDTTAQSRAFFLR